MLRPISWENFTLEQQNILASYLHDHARGRYRLWNDVYRQGEIGDGADRGSQIKPFVEEHNLPHVVGHCVAGTFWLPAWRVSLLMSVDRASSQT